MITYIPKATISTAEIFYEAEHSRFIFILGLKLEDSLSTP